jgi:hypothetical protein
MHSGGDAAVLENLGLTLPPSHAAHGYFVLHAVCSACSFIVIGNFILFFWVNGNFIFYLFWVNMNFGRK